MGLVTGDNYNPALAPAIMNFDLLFHQNGEAYVDKLLAGKDEISKTDIMSRMDQFSCREELERYVDRAESHRFPIVP
ncbi:MAG: hypothetical protein NC300_11980 [Bacteroidales bacterium]|nr:hypothetical protein [Clostridium sp.]MCM1204850.1 hypothetical protein [Bacteroidales bacterium]